MRPGNEAKTQNTSILPDETESASTAPVWSDRGCEGASYLASFSDSWLPSFWSIRVAMQQIIHVTSFPGGNMGYYS